MKLILFLLLMVTVNAHAAKIRCTYTAQPCDDKGNHYFCQMYAWGNGEFCSATPQKLIEEKENEAEEYSCSFRPEICGFNSVYCNGHCQRVTNNLSEDENKCYRNENSPNYNNCIDRCMAKPNANCVICDIRCGGW